MPVRDVTISGEIKKEYNKPGHGFWAIPKDTFVGFRRGLRKKYGADNVAQGAVGSSSDAAALSHTRRVLGKRVKMAESDAADARHVAHETRNVNKLVSQHAQTQTSYLVSIDSTLKGMAKQTQTDRMEAAREKAEKKISRRKSIMSDLGAFKRKFGKKAGEIGEGAKDFASDKFTIGNFLKYGAAIASTGYDMYQGGQKGKDWGVGTMLGGLIGGVAGSGKGGFTNAVKKAVDLGTLGGMLAGPIGALVGAIVGGIAGWLGGEDVAKFFKDLMDRIPETLFEKYTGMVDQQISKMWTSMLSAPLAGLDWITKMGKTISLSMTTALKKLAAWFEDSVGSMLVTMGKVLPGTAGDIITGMGASLKEDAAERKKKIDADYNSTKKQIEKESDDPNTLQNRYLKFRQDKLDKMEEENSFSNIYTRTARDKNGVRKVPRKELDFWEQTKTGLESAYNDLKDSDKEGQFFPVMGSAPKTSPVPGGNRAKGMIRPWALQPPKETPEQVMSHINKSTMDVGDVPGADIKSMVGEANRTASSSNINFQVPAEAIAAIIAQESGGNLKKPQVGDGGKSVGITQMQQGALDDVNKEFKTNFTQDQIKSDYKTAIKASTLFMRLKLAQTNGNLPEAIRRYNGAGFQAERYKRDTIQKMSAIQQKQSQPALNVTSATPQILPMKQQDGGARLHVATIEGQALRDKPTQVSASPSVVAPVTNINSNKTLNMPLPSTRNDDSSLLNSYYGG
jgi:hypothetical protein